MTLALFALLLVSVVPVLLRRPEIAVFSLSFLLAINATLVFSLRFGISDTEKLLLAAGIALILSYRLVYRRRLFGTTRFVFAVLLWLVPALNSLLWSNAIEASLGAIWSFLPNILLSGMIFFLIDDRARLLHALAGVAVGCLFLSSITIFQYVLSLGSFDFYGLANGAYDHIAGEVDAFRPAGTLYDPNYYAQMLLPGAALFLAAALGVPKRRMRIWLITAALTIVLAILLTSSRGGLLALAAVILTLLVFDKRLSLVVLLVPPVLIALAFVPSYNARIVSVIEAVAALATGQQVRDPSFAGRLAEMEAAFILFQSAPVSGVGYGSFEAKYQQVSARYDLKLRAADRAAHSLYLETAAEQGWIGLAGLFGIIGMAFTASARLRSFSQNQGDRTLQFMSAGLVAGGVGIFVSSLFLHDAYGLAVWLMIALLFASERVTLRTSTPAFLPRGALLYGR